MGSDPDLPVRPAPASDPPSPAEELLETLHRAPRAFRDEALAPPVDRERLGALVRRELDESTAASLYHLIHSFRSWSDAYAALLVEEFHRAGCGQAGEPSD